MFSLISNTLEEFLDKFEEAPEGLQTYLSTGVLLGTAERHATLLDRRKLFTCRLLSVALSSSSVELLCSEFVLQ